ncbi:hypothetical protein U6G28_08730 [Actinomycetaceae bacterium MB13-C1-2]|nr:hypothetical protein U6G28_08730 [Actinomycetaceae bacterium MB13-C1-2]
MAYQLEDGRPLMLRDLAGKTTDVLIALTAPLWLPGLLVLSALWARDNDPT